MLSTQQQPEMNARTRAKKAKERELVYDIQLIFFSPKCLPAEINCSHNLPHILFGYSCSFNMNGHYNHVYSHSATDPFSLLKHQHPNGRDPPSSTYFNLQVLFFFSISRTSYFFDFEILISAGYPFWMVFVSATFELKRP